MPENIWALVSWTFLFCLSARGGQAWPAGLLRASMRPGSTESPQQECGPVPLPRICRHVPSQGGTGAEPRVESLWAQGMPVLLLEDPAAHPAGRLLAAGPTEPAQHRTPTHLPQGQWEALQQLVKKGVFHCHGVAESSLFPAVAIPSRTETARPAALVGAFEAPPAWHPWSLRLGYSEASATVMPLAPRSLVSVDFTRISPSCPPQAKRLPDPCHPLGGPPGLRPGASALSLQLDPGPGWPRRRKGRSSRKDHRPSGLKHNRGPQSRGGLWGAGEIEADPDQCVQAPAASVLEEALVHSCPPPEPLLPWVGGCPESGRLSLLVGFLRKLLDSTGHHLSPKLQAKVL
ncbi:uncharacterized protein LOC113196123 isoform X2 [Urocitellus parryii]